MTKKCKSHFSQAATVFGFFMAKNTAFLSDANTVGDVYFRLFSTKFPGSKSLLEWEDATDSEERILFDEDTQTASLVEDTMFDPTLKTIVVAHGNTGKLQVDRLLWKSYSEAANNGKSNKK